ncbi:hypothetical protein EMCRGX_G008627 [Ephydatia muelleri]
MVFYLPVLCPGLPVHNGKAVVQLVNPSYVPATLHSQEKVGQMSPLEELDEPALDANPPSRSTKVVGKAVEELMGDISGLSREEHARLKNLGLSYRLDVHPLPRIDDALDTLAGSRWFSTLDLASGYWQVEMDPADREKTAFITPFGLHQFQVMPFGLTNAPSTFQRLIRGTLAAAHGGASQAKGGGAEIKPSKCHVVLCKSVHYLGYVVSEDGIAADPEKIKCVNNWPTPTDHESLRQFLGFASYYRKFIHHFADIAIPLHALTEKTKPCMALDITGAVLSHQHHGRVIAYASRVLTKTERQYCATRSEMLALVRQFRAYLWGRKFIVRTDHNALRLLCNFKDPQGQVARWLEILAEFDIDVVHRPGLQHGNADALSRLQCKQCGMQSGGALCLFHNACDADSCVGFCGATPLSQFDVQLSAELSYLPRGDPREIQSSDSDIRRVISWVKGTTPTPAVCPSEGSYTLQTLWAQHKHLVVRDEVLFRQWEDVPGKGQTPKVGSSSELGVHHLAAAS